MCHMGEISSGVWALSMLQRYAHVVPAEDFIIMKTTTNIVPGRHYLPDISKSRICLATLCLRLVGVEEINNFTFDDDIYTCQVDTTKKLYGGLARMLLDFIDVNSLETGDPDDMLMSVIG